MLACAAQEAYLLGVTRDSTGGAAMELLVCFGFVFVAIPIGFVIYHFSTKAAAEEGLSNARNAYLHSLELLRRDPRNVELRERTLALGRTKVKFFLGWPGQVRVAPFVEEVALMNDI